MQLIHHKSAHTMGRKTRSLFRASYHQKLMYKQHKEALSKISSAVDIGPPLIKKDVYLNIRGMRSDKFALRRIIKENIELLERLNRIRRTHGLSNSYNTRKRISQTKLHHVVRRIDHIESENVFLGCRLLKVKPMLSRSGLAVSARSSSVKFERSPISLKIREKLLMDQLLHPKVYLDLEVKNIRPLGRVVIQLYTEACPEIVLEFARSCSENKVHLFNFIRIFPGLWIEGEIAVKNRLLSRPNFQHDINIIRHEANSGILSFAKRYVNTGFPHGLFNFTVSFKPMPVLNGERVAFGELLAGHRVMACAQDYGTKNGKVKKQILVVHSGLKAYLGV
uniref:Peptidyl-prolyl cis-trans isomerase n=1 Tax=Ceratitis capitata TaxID=7213 RepID=W8C5S1_CERCA